MISMKYNVQLNTTVEAPSAAAAEQMVFDMAADFAGEVEVTAVPTKQWNVEMEVTPVLTFSLTVNAESAEDARNKAYGLVENEAYGGDSIPGVLDLAAFNDYEMGDLDINTYDATPVEEDTQPATVTEISAA